MKKSVKALEEIDATCEVNDADTYLLFTKAY